MHCSLYGPVRPDPVKVLQVCCQFKALACNGSGSALAILQQAACRKYRGIWLNRDDSNCYILYPALRSQTPPFGAALWKGSTRMTIYRKALATLPVMVLVLTGLALAADPDVLKSSSSLDRLFKKTGVYNTSSTGKTPGFVVDPSWPQPLPN